MRQLPEVDFWTMLTQIANVYNQGFHSAIWVGRTYARGSILGVWYAGGMGPKHGYLW